MTKGSGKYIYLGINIYNKDAKGNNKLGHKYVFSSMKENGSLNLLNVIKCLFFLYYFFLNIYLFKQISRFRPILTWVIFTIQTILRLLKVCICFSCFPRIDRILTIFLQLFSVFYFSFPTCATVSVSLVNGISIFAGYLMPKLCSKRDMIVCLTFSWGVRGFPKGLGPKMNVITQMEF